jgi:hypothetical protein
MALEKKVEHAFNERDSPRLIFDVLSLHGVWHCWFCGQAPVHIDQLAGRRRAQALYSVLV